MNLCKCGCGNPVKGIWKRGHCCRGTKHSEETKKKISFANSGQKNGMSRTNYVRSEEERNYSSKLLKERLKNLEFKNKFLHYPNKSQICRLAQIQAVKSRLSKGIKQYNHTFTAEEKAERSRKVREFWKNPEFRNKMVNYPGKRIDCRKGALEMAKALKQKRFYDTKPELIMKSLLEKLNINFIHPAPIDFIEHKYMGDFLLQDYNVVIEVDGKHWHYYPYGKDLDWERMSELDSKGYYTIRFWDDELTEQNLLEQLKLSRVEVEIK